MKKKEDAGSGPGALRPIKDLKSDYSAGAASTSGFTSSAIS